MMEYGPVIGSIGGKPIYDFVVIGGVRHDYAGLAQLDPNGDVDLDKLENGDFVLPPILLYVPVNI